MNPSSSLSNQGTVSQSVRPTPQLANISSIRKAMLDRSQADQVLQQQLQSLSPEDRLVIAEAFPLGTNTHAQSYVKRMTDEELRQLAPNRLEGFFQSSDTVFIDPIYCRLFYKESDESFFVYFVKPSKEAGKGHSHMKISGFELPKLIAYIEKIMGEIKQTALFDTIPSLDHPDADNMDMRSEFHFNKEFAFHTPSGKLRCRPLRSETGIYQFRFHQLKPVDGNFWNGPIITISRVVTERLLQQFRKYFEWLQINSSNNVKVYSETPSDVEYDDDNDDAASAGSESHLPPPIPPNTPTDDQSPKLKRTRRTKH